MGIDQLVGQCLDDEDEKQSAYQKILSKIFYLSAKNEKKVNKTFLHTLLLYIPYMITTHH